MERKNKWKGMEMKDNGLISNLQNWIFIISKWERVHHDPLHVNFITNIFFRVWFDLFQIMKIIEVEQQYNIVNCQELVYKLKNKQDIILHLLAPHNFFERMMKTNETTRFLGTSLRTRWMLSCGFTFTSK